jgi:hypothetical protein
MLGSWAHAPVSRRPPISLDTIVARTRMYTYAANVWDLSIVQGPSPVIRSLFHFCLLRFAAFFIAVWFEGMWRRGPGAQKSKKKKSKKSKKDDSDSSDSDSDSSESDSDEKPDPEGEMRLSSFFN